VLALLLAIPFRERLVALVQSQPPTPIEPQDEAGAGQAKPPPVDPRDDPAWRTQGKIDESRARLQAGDNGVTHDTLRESADGLLGRLKGLQENYRVEWPGVIAKDGPNRDPVDRITAAIEGAIKACRAVEMVLLDARGAKLQNLEQAEKDFKAAAIGFEALEAQVDRLESDAKAERDRQTEMQKANDLEARRQTAFQEFQSIGRTVRLPASGGGADLGGGATTVASRGKAAEIDLGPFRAADLVEPGFRMAVPKATVDDKQFEVQIVQGGDPKGSAWEIQYVPSGVDTDGKAQKVRTLATLIARDGRLVLEVPKSNELNLAPFALLRRSVILAEAKDPAAPEAPAVVQEIRLVEPTKVRPLVIDLFAEQRQELKIAVPPGIPRTVKAVAGSNATLAIPIASVRIDAELPGGQKVSYELPKDAAEGSDPGIGSWKNILLAQLDPELAIEADIKLSLLQATLAVETRLTGNKAGWFSKEKIKECFIDKPDEVLNNFEKGLRARIKTGEAFTFAQARTAQGNEKILAWFGQALVRQDMGMPGHETFGKSFELFLRERYDEAAKDMKPPQRPDLPKDAGEFESCCQEVKDDSEWQSVFTNRVSAWATWFWPKFSEQFQEKKKLFQAAVAKRHEIRITKITSLAYDETDKAYEVRLVVLEEAPAAPTGAGPGAPKGDAVGID
jgi:hypothetical protein